MKSLHKPLRQKLLVTFLPIVLLPLTIAGIWSGIVTHQRTIGQAEQRLKNQSKLTAAMTHKELEGKLTLLDAISADSIILQAAQESSQQAKALSTFSIAQLETQFAQTKRLKPDLALEKHLRNLASVGNFAELFFTERSGLNVSYTKPPSHFVQRNELWWQQSRQYQHWVGIPEFDHSTQKDLIGLTQVIVDPDTRQVSGVVKAEYDAISLGHLKAELKNLQLLGSERMQMVAVGDKVTPIFTIAPEKSAQEKELLGGEAIMQKATELVKAVKRRALEQGQQIAPSLYQHTHDHANEPTKKAASEQQEHSKAEEFNLLTETLVVGDRWYAVTKIPGVDWVAVASIEVNQAQAGSYQIVSIFALVFVGLGAVATIVILRVSKHLSAPLNRLSQAARQVSEQADFTVQVPVSMQDEETRVLADSFNQMIQRVRQLLAEQIEAKRQLENYSQTLEEKVDERTQELNEKTQRLKDALKELKRTQAEIVQSEKMSSLGQLVAGIAHEINNPVNFIHGNIGHVRDNVEDLLSLIELYQAEYKKSTPAIAKKIGEIDLQFLQSDIPKLLSSVEAGTERIREIVKSLRIFSRLDEAEVKAIDIHEGTDSTLMILQSRLKAKPDRVEIQVIKDYAELPYVDCFAGQLNQVFMHILTNSIDALEEVLTTQPAHQPQIKIGTKLEQDWVEIAIADNGTGISKAVQSRIFDPFFTTKAVGKGTGMGMSISYQIITKKHSGQLECISAPGQGALFLIRIPTHQKSLT